MPNNYNKINTYKNTPKLRFPGFSGEWVENKLGSFFYSEKGSGLSKDSVVVDGKNECILYGQLYTTYNEIIHDIKSKTNSTNGLKSKVGDLLMPCSTTTTGIDLANATALNKDGVLLGGDITVLRSKNKFSNIFYAYYLSNYKKKDIANIAQGSTIIHLYYSHLKKISIKMPTFPEQQKIAEFLGLVDEWIDNLKSQKKSLEKYKKEIMKRLFDGSLRFFGFHDKWENTTLYYYAADKRHSIVDGPFGSQMKVHEFIKDGIPVVEMEHLNNNQTVGFVSRFISKEKFEKIKRSAIFPNDILISKTGTIGLLGIVPSSINPGMITSRLAKISTNNKKAYNIFIFYCLMNLNNIGYWLKVSQGGTMQILGTKTLKSVPVPKISINEQQKIADFLSSVDDILESKQKQINQAEKWKKGLMQGLFV